MDWWGIVVIVVVGVAVVIYGYFDDKRKTRERDAAMQAPPQRDIPRFHPTNPAPEYLSELKARSRPDKLPSTDLDDATRTDQAGGERQQAEGARLRLRATRQALHLGRRGAGRL